MRADELSGGLGPLLPVGEKFGGQRLCVRRAHAAFIEPAPQRIQPEAAFALMAAEAAKGDVNAILTLGRFYEQGVGVSRNYTKAMEWYDKAAKAGQPEGYYNLGVCYEIGMGVTADAAKAVRKSCSFP